MFEVRNGIHLLIVVYIIISLVIWHIKPNIMFRNDEMLPFGIGKDKSIFNYQIVIILLSILMFYIFEIIWLKRNNFL